MALGPFLILIPTQKIFVERGILKKIVEVGQHKNTRYTAMFVYLLIVAAQGFGTISNDNYIYKKKTFFFLVTYAIFQVLNNIFVLPILYVRNSVHFCANLDGFYHQSRSVSLLFTPSSPSSTSLCFTAPCLKRAL